MRTAEVRGLVAWQAVVFVALVAAWQAAGLVLDPTWIGSPTLVAARLAEWLKGDLYRHLAVTLSEIAMGVIIGGTLGTVIGLCLGTARYVGAVLRPMVVTLYNVPLVTLAPLFIVWFGFGIESKVVLVSISAFFIVFFNAFSGAQKVDADVVQNLRLMGASRIEMFVKVVVPASMAWIVAGFKIALPYALVAATTGEMLAARDGLGSLLAKAAAQFDMTGVYAVLFILMLLGMLVGEVAVRGEQFLLRWRHAKR